MEKKLNIAKELLGKKIEELVMSKEFVVKAPERFIGVSLQEEVKRWSNDVIQSEVTIEALQMYISDLSWKLQQAKEGVIDCPRCDKEHDRKMSCLEAGVIRMNV